MARRDTRAGILEAAERVGRHAGLGRVTTKAIAAEAACSEASIYYHFNDRTDLLAEVVARRIATVSDRLAELTLPAKGSLAVRLGALLDGLTDALVDLVGLSAPLLADPDVVQRFRAVLEEQGAAPHGLVSTVAQRLREEQSAGRLRADADVDAVALLVLGACHEIAFHAHLMGEPATARSSHSRLSKSLAVLLKPQ